MRYSSTVIGAFLTVNANVATVLIRSQHPKNPLSKIMSTFSKTTFTPPSSFSLILHVPFPWPEADASTSSTLSLPPSLLYQNHICLTPHMSCNCDSLIYHLYVSVTNILATPSLKNSSVNNMQLVRKLNICTVLYLLKRSLRHICMIDLLNTCVNHICWSFF
jgi:hypothetical protein